MTNLLRFCQSLGVFRILISKNSGLDRPGTSAALARAARGEVTGYQPTFGRSVIPALPTNGQTPVPTRKNVGKFAELRTSFVVLLAAVE